MVARGGRGEIIANSNGFEAAFKADALSVGTSTAAASGPECCRPATVEAGRQHSSSPPPTEPGGEVARCNGAIRRVHWSGTTGARGGKRRVVAPGAYQHSNRTRQGRPASPRAGPFPSAPVCRRSTPIGRPPGSGTRWIPGTGTGLQAGGRDPESETKRSTRQVDVSTAGTKRMTNGRRAGCTSASRPSGASTRSSGSLGASPRAGPPTSASSDRPTSSGSGRTTRHSPAEKRNTGLN